MPDLIVNNDGRLTYVWDDDLSGLVALGRPDIRRVSHVEPTRDGTWTADLSPVGGPRLGPFPLHATAVAAERAWLAERLSEGLL